MYKTHTLPPQLSKPTIPKKYLLPLFFGQNFPFCVLNIHSSLVDYTDACCIYEINVLRIYSYYTHTYTNAPLPTHPHTDIYSIYEWQLSDLLIATWAGYTTMLGR